jgi:Domain of unknown function (DUF6285)
MTQDRPTAAELVAAVREFLEHDVFDAVEGRVQFHTRVAINALGMVERELVTGPQLAEAEHARAAALLGTTVDAAEHERTLAARIRDGTLDDQDDAVRAHVRATVREKLLVANPGYIGESGPA